MTKRKKASSSTSRPARPRPQMGGARSSGSGRNVARVTESDGTPGSDPSSVQPARPQMGGARLTLAAECMVSEATSLKERLAALLDEPQPVTLDVAALQRIDTAGLQVIVAFVRERAGAGRAVEWQGTAPVLATAAQLLGLTSLLNLPA
jgi:phospholipid transport system transporter-binding protein